jgi:very-short-patch-repair endonuclease
MWSLRLLDGASLHRLLRDLGRRGRNGTAGVRRYLADRGGSYVPAASGLEARVLQILRHAGIDMRRQVDTGDDVQWTGRVDFRHVTLPVILEVQSERHHEALVDRRSDDVRRARLVAAGFIVAEVTDAEVWQRPSAVVERVNAAIRACDRP